MKLKVLDLFSGAGGMSLGFELSGEFKVVSAVDFWEPAVSTFKYNHPKLDPSTILCASVEDIFSQMDERFEGYRRHLNDEGVDVIVGGPPCQGMSLAGKRLSDDPRNQLFKSFVDAVRLLRPKAFVMENVPGLLSHGNGKINSAILEAFAAIGYNHFEQHAPTILKAECYGVPQVRRRLFYVGFREDISPQFLDWPPVPVRQEFQRSRSAEMEDLFSNDPSSLKLLPPVTVAEAISDLPSLASGQGSDELPYAPSVAVNDFQLYCRDWQLSPNASDPLKIYNHQAPNHTEKLIEMIAAADFGKSVDPNYSDSKKWHPNEPGFTVKALGAGGGSTNRRAFHYDTSQRRASTVRENARIQSFPDWYRFLGPKTHQMTQVGNAVPPLLAKAIAQSLAAKLRRQ
jgi:DNA (cytosine-5)-methyltransferase 1